MGKKVFPWTGKKFADMGDREKEIVLDRIGSEIPKLLPDDCQFILFVFPPGKRVDYMTDLNRDNPEVIREAGRAIIKVADNLEGK